MSATALNQYDVIVIGSGIGGLTTASLLAQIDKKKVLVIERAAKLGGLTHCFTRQKFEWDVGVHYVGEMNEGSMPRRIMDMVTRKGVKWHRMGPVCERIIFPCGSFEVPSDPKLYEQRLIERFPAEADNIRIYFRDLRRAHGWITRWYVSKQCPPWLESLFTLGRRKLVGTVTADYLARFQDPMLRAILAAQWPNYGTPPHQSAFGHHATVAAHFFDGGYYPVGGAKEIARHAALAITDAGGACLVSHEVKEVLVENGAAVGVKVERKGEMQEYRAPVVISDAGVGTTFGQLVPPGLCAREREKLARLKSGTSAIILFLGLEDDPRKHGFDDANYWLYRRLDHDTSARVREGEPDRLDGAYVSFGSLRNPGQSPHTAQIISFCDKGPWAEFAGTSWMRRGEAYEQRKEKIAQDMLDFAEARMPGLRSLVKYHELSTPLTVETFANHKEGMIYGQLCDPNRLFRDRWTISTSLRNLFLTGSDVGSPGVDGAMMAGVMTAARVLGVFGLPRIFTPAYTD